MLSVLEKPLSLCVCMYVCLLYIDIHTYLNTHGLPSMKLLYAEIYSCSHYNTLNPLQAPTPQPSPSPTPQLSSAPTPQPSPVVVVISQSNYSTIIIVLPVGLTVTLSSLVYMVHHFYKRRQQSEVIYTHMWKFAFVIFALEC